MRKMSEDYRWNVVYCPHFLGCVDYQLGKVGKYFTLITYVTLNLIELDHEVLWEPGRLADIVIY